MTAPTCFSDKLPSSGRYNTKTYKPNTSNLHIQCYQYHIKKNYAGHKGKNVDIIDSVMLTYS